MPENLTLLDSQKKQTLAICIAAGIPPHEFRWEVVQGGNSAAPSVSQLVHVPSGFYFLFDFVCDGTYLSEFSPGEAELKSRHEHSYCEASFGLVKKWAGYVAREIEAQAFIKRIEESRPLEELAIAVQDNAPLSAKEQRQIEVKLDELETYVLRIREFQEEEASQIKQQFQQLRDELRRAGRNSWLQMLIGTLVTIGTAYVDPDVARAIWAHANEHIGAWYTTLCLTGD